jgi:ribosome biogenesis GTPase A
VTAPSPALGVAVRGVLRDAIEVYRDSPQAVAWLRQHLARFEEPLRVAVAGKVKAGKSTLLNALVGEEIAPTDAGECTRVVTWYQDGPSPKVLMIPRQGQARQLTVSRRDGALVIDLGGTPAERVDRLVVDWPSQSLRTTALIDTPGIASLSADTSARAGAFLVPEDAPAPADAKQAVRKHLDEVQFQVGKDSRDMLRHVQRQLRDHFTALAEELQTSIDASVKSAQKAVSTDSSARGARIRDLEAELARIAALEEKARALMPGPRKVLA